MVHPNSCTLGSKSWLVHLASTCLDKQSARAFLVPLMYWIFNLQEISMEQLFILLFSVLSSKIFSRGLWSQRIEHSASCKKNLGLLMDIYIENASLTRAAYLPCVLEIFPEMNVISLRLFKLSASNVY